MTSKRVSKRASKSVQSAAEEISDGISTDVGCPCDLVTYAREGDQKASARARCQADCSDDCGRGQRNSKSDAIVVLVIFCELFLPSFRLFFTRFLRNSLQ